MALHAARRIALQLIFARMFHSDDNASVLEEETDLESAREDQDFIDEALAQTGENAGIYDDLISKYSPQRALERVPVLDRAILHLAFHELSQPDAPRSVIINEAVELAKRFGDESDGRFINGVLGTHVRAME